MKALKTIVILTLCLFSLPALAGNGNEDGNVKKENKTAKENAKMTNAEIRKVKKNFTKTVRAMKAAKNHPEGQEVIQGKFGSK